MRNYSNMVGLEKDLNPDQKAIYLWKRKKRIKEFSFEKKGREVETPTTKLREGFGEHPELQRFVHIFTVKFNWKKP